MIFRLSHSTENDIQTACQLAHRISPSFNFQDDWKRATENTEIISNEFFTKKKKIIIIRRDEQWTVNNEHGIHFVWNYWIEILEKRMTLML